MGRPGDGSDDRILVLAPSGRDAEMVRARLLGAGIACEVCADTEALLASMASPAGAALIAQEALLDGRAEALLAALEAQEPWSDLPVLLLTEPARNARSRTRAPSPISTSASAGLFERANVTLLERPIPLSILLSTLRAAVRARRRQYETRDLLRELQRAVQLSELFVGILGHDLRTPLSAIQLSADSILRLPDDRAQRAARRILSSTGRMTGMIGQLLDFARVRQGQGIPFHPRTANLGEICRAVVEEIEGANPQAHLHLQAQGDLAGAWDPDRLAQVVSNLVGNAVQHGARGTSIDIELDGTAPGWVNVRVHNQGSVPAPMIPSLFEAFKGTEALDRKDRRSQAGLGLGLYIARAITLAHGGDIAVRSSETEGTTFEVVLPRWSSTEEMAPATLS